MAYQQIRKKPVSSRLYRIIAVSIGFWAGHSIHAPVNRWDDSERDRSGLILTQQLETYKAATGHYPHSLSQLDTVLVNTLLPYNYKLDRFSYHWQKEEYHLDIPVPLLDRWHWNQASRKWDYD